MKKWLIPVIVIIVLIVCAISATVVILLRPQEENYGKYNDITQWEDNYDSVPIDEVTTFTEGMHVYFGAYEQDNDKENGKEPIIWRVLDVQDGKVLLLSEYVLDQINYNKKKTSVTWESCDLRRWLNSDFYEEAFSSTEQRRIVETELINKDNPVFGTDGGENTKDYCFILSIDEIEHYFNVKTTNQTDTLCSYCNYTIYNKARLAAPITAYANSVQAVYYKGTSKCKHIRYMGFWWTRTPGATSRQVAYIRGDSNILIKGDDVHFASAAVRPAIWVNINN